MGVFRIGHKRLGRRKYYARRFTVLDGYIALYGYSRLTRQKPTEFLILSSKNYHVYCAVSILKSDECHSITVLGDFRALFYYDTHKRNRGLGYRLLDYSVKTSRGKGLESLFLEVRSKNLPAIKLYEAYGFKRVGMRKGYYKNPDDDAIVMLKASRADILEF